MVVVLAALFVSLSGGAAAETYVATKENSASLAAAQVAQATTANKMLSTGVDVFSVCFARLRSLRPLYAREVTSPRKVTRQAKNVV